MARGRPPRKVLDDLSSSSRRANKSALSAAMAPENRRCSAGRNALATIVHSDVDVRIFPSMADELTCMALRSILQGVLYGALCLFRDLLDHVGLLSDPFWSQVDAAAGNCSCCASSRLAALLAGHR